MVVVVVIVGLAYCLWLVNGGVYLYSGVVQWISAVDFVIIKKNKLLPLEI